MRPLVALVALALLTLAPAPATAQQAGALTLRLVAPDEPLREGEPLVYTGVATLTVDYSAIISSPSGIPVTYAIAERPEWAAVSLSPASDVFPAPASPGPGFAYSVSRAFTVTLTLAHDKADDASGTLGVEAATTPGFAGKSFLGRAEAPVQYDAPDEPCPEHALAQEQLTQAVAAYNAYQAEQASPEEDVTVQSTRASPLSVPWVALAGFALAGAGVGLALRRRVGRG